MWSARQGRVRLVHSDSILELQPWACDRSSCRQLVSDGLLLLLKLSHVCCVILSWNASIRAAAKGLHCWVLARCKVCKSVQTAQIGGACTRFSSVHVEQS
jgi:hypothetical protein